MKESEIMPLHISYAPVEQMDELNKALNISAKIYLRCGEYEFTLSAETTWIQMQLNWLLQYLILRAKILAEMLKRSHS